MIAGKSLLFGLPPIAVSVAVCIFGLISLNRRNAKESHFLFAFFCFSVSIWALFYGLMYLNSPRYALFLARAGYKGVVFIPAFALDFTFAYSGRTLSRICRILLYSTSITFLFLTQSSKFLRAVGLFFWGPYPLAGSAYKYFVAYFVLSFLASVAVLYRTLPEKRARGSLEFNQAKFVLLAYSIASTSFVDYIPNYGYSIYPYAYLSAFGWLALIAYATLRYRLMDFNLVLRWGIGYAVSALVIAILFTVLFVGFARAAKELAGIGPGAILLTTVCLSVFAVDPIHRMIRAYTDQFIFRSPDLKQHLDSVSSQLSLEDPVEVNVAHLSEEIKRIWPVDHAGIALWNLSKAAFDVMPKKQFETQAISRHPDSITNADFLVRTLESERRLFKYGIVLEDELTALGTQASAGERLTFWKIRRTMRYLGASICVPLMVRSQLIGIIVIGQKRNNSVFNDEDRKFLAHVAERVSAFFFQNLQLTQGLS